MAVNDPVVSRRQLTPSARGTTENRESKSKDPLISSLSTPNKALAFRGSFGTDIAIGIAQGGLGSVKDWSDRFIKKKKLGNTWNRHTVDPRVAALCHGTISQDAFVAVIVNAPQRWIIPRLGSEELGTVRLRRPLEMEPNLRRVFREGARDARMA